VIDWNLTISAVLICIVLWLVLYAAFSDLVRKEFREFFRLSPSEVELPIIGSGILIWHRKRDLLRCGPDSLGNPYSWRLKLFLKGVVGIILGLVCAISFLVLFNPVYKKVDYFCNLTSSAFCFDLWAFRLPYSAFD